MATASTGGLHRAAPKSTALKSSFQRGVDIVLSMAMLALVSFLVMVALDARTGERAAHAWARYVGVHQENACPTAFGNAFWFACASEVRRLNSERR